MFSFTPHRCTRGVPLVPIGQNAGRSSVAGLDAVGMKNLLPVPEIEPRFSDRLAHYLAHVDKSVQFYGKI
jgi:hypothetical protein